MMVGGVPSRPGRKSLHAHGAGGDRLRHARHLDQAHAAIAGDRQPLVIAEARDLDAGQLARLQQRDAAGTSISRLSMISFGMVLYASIPTPPPRHRRRQGRVAWASMRASIRGGNGGSGPGPARRRHRRARRSVWPST